MAPQPMMAEIQSTVSNQVRHDWAGFIFPSQFIFRSVSELSGRPCDASSCALGKWPIEDCLFVVIVVCLHILFRWTQDSIESALSKFDREAEDCLRAGYRLGVERYRQRKQLMEMDDRLIKDIGITPEQAELEAGRPIWRA